MEFVENTVAKISDIGMNLIFFNVIPFIPGQKIEFLIAVLTVISIIFTIILKFPNFRFIIPGLKFLFKKNHETTNEKNAISSSKAFWSTISGIVGVGNIAGMAAAIYFGGPGTVFWILIFGFITMPLRYMEIYFGHKLRKVENGEIKACGTFAYIEYTANQMKSKFFGNFLTKFFTIGIIGASLGAISFQANPMVNAVSGSEITAGNKMIIAFIIALGVLYAITGGLNRIVGITSKLGSYMSGIYIVSVCAIIGFHWQNIPFALSLIMNEAINPTPTSFCAGVITMIFYAFRRATIASEVGLGTGALLHGMSSRKSSSDEAKLGMLAPFFGSLIFCSLNGLMLVVGGAYNMGDGGIETMRATFVSLHPLMNYVLIVIIYMFGLSTIIVWFYFAQSALQKLTQNKIAINALPYFYAVLVFITGITQFKTLLPLIDLTVTLLIFPNIFALIYLTYKFKKQGHKFI